MRARLQAHRWTVTGGAMLMLMAIATVGRSSQVRLPFAPLPIPTYLLVTVGTIIFMIIPLVGAFPEFERVLLRERRLRILRAICVVVLASVTTLVSHAANDVGLTQLRGDAPLLMILAAIGITAVVVVGELAWLVTATLCILSLFAVAALDSPLARVLPLLPLPALLALIIVASALYVWRGPRLPN